MIDVSATITLGYTVYPRYASAKSIYNQGPLGYKAVIKPGRDFGTIEYYPTHLQEDFARHFTKLKKVESDRTLWPEGAERPSQLATAQARLILQQLESDALPPTQVVASAEGGVAICFVCGDKYSDIECLNTGAILGVTSNRRDRPFVWEVDQGPSGIALASARIRQFLHASAADANDPKWQTKG